MSRRRGRLPDEPPEFFADVPLAKTCPEQLGAAGWSITGWWEHFPEAATESIADEQWIADVYELGYCNVITKDARMYYSEVIRTTIENCGMRVFALSNAELKADVMTARFVTNQDQIWRLTTVDQPMIYIVYASSLGRKL